MAMLEEGIPGDPQEQAQAQRASDIHIDSEPVKRSLSDLVVEVFKSPDQDYHFLRTEDLEQAMRDGTLSEEEINRSLGINKLRGEFTLSGKIRLIEAAKANGQEYNQAELDQYRAMQEARPGYIPADDNLTFNIFSDDRQQLQQDFSAWLRGRRGIYEHKLEYLHSEEEALSTVFTESEDILARFTPVLAHLVLDYPSLNYTMRIFPIKQSANPNDRQFLRGGDYVLGIGFNSGGSRLLEGTSPCAADMLSLVRMANSFKEKGHSVQFQMSQNPVKTADGTSIRYMAR